MLALNLYTSPSNNGGIVLYLDVDLGHMPEISFFYNFNFKQLFNYNAIYYFIFVTK